MSNEFKFLLSWKLTYPSFLNYFSTMSLSIAIALKVSFSGKKEFFCSMESVQISPCGFVCRDARKVDVSEFQVKN